MPESSFFAPGVKPFHRFLPSREQIQANRWLAWLGPRLHHPALWHWSRRGVALGVALGVFFGLLVPLAQIPLSVAAAVFLRANIPAAAGSTLITNPVTFAPVYYAAYQVGGWLLGEAGAAPALNAEVGLLDQLAAMGAPLLLGLVLFAVVGGGGVYLLVHWVWRWRVLTRRRQRVRQYGAPPSSGRRP